MSVSKKIVADFVANDIEFVTTVPCKQLGGVIDAVENEPSIYHIPANKEDEGMGLCAGAFMGGKRPAIIMQNTAIGVTVNTLVTLTQFYRMPLPMLISYRGELKEPVACQVEMAVHTKALLNQLNIPTLGRNAVPFVLRTAVCLQLYAASLCEQQIFLQLKNLFAEEYFGYQQIMPHPLT